MTKGLLKSGEISKKSGFIYQKFLWELSFSKDSSEKIILSLSDSISHILLASVLKEKLYHDFKI